MQEGVGRGGQVVGGEGRMGECLCCVVVFHKNLDNK
jgi:hypothetical protein